MKKFTKSLKPTRILRIRGYIFFYNIGSLRQKVLEEISVFYINFKFSRFVDAKAVYFTFKNMYIYPHIIKAFIHDESTSPI